MREATITINGVPISEAQSMALRVAVTSMHGDMSRPGALGKDDTGEAIRQGYFDRLGEILEMIIPAAQPASEPR